MKTALLSVYNKSGIEEFAKQLVELGWQLFASGGTAKTLAKAGVPVKDVAELVGGGAILGHRVVTLSREIHAGLQATDSQEDVNELETLKIPRIDLACVDLYPLHKAINTPGSTPESVIEQTDIGGPTILRSAAKGRRIVICDPDDRQRVIDWLKNGKPDEDTFITELAAKAEAVAAEYSLTSARYHSKGKRDGFIGHQVAACRYGENPWQTPAVLFSTGSDYQLSLDRFKSIAGIEPSYINLVDVARLIQTITHIAAVFDIKHSRVPLIAVACKHGNACGAAVGTTPVDVIRMMVSGDIRAIFGGVIMTNFLLDETTAEALLTHMMAEGQRRLLDGIIAPAFTDKAVQMLRRKKDKCRFLINPALGHLDHGSLDSAPLFRYVPGGFLRQPNYTFVLNPQDPRLERIGDVTPERENDLFLAWAIGSTSNSNTITLVRDDYLIGNGVGQNDRVGACRLAVRKAKEMGHDLNGAVAYSDSFFPFPDGPAVLAVAGIKAILTSSGSIRDEEVKTLCRKNKVSVYFIPDKVGRGFFNH